MAEDFFKRFDEAMQTAYPAAYAVQAEAAAALPAVQNSSKEAASAGIPIWVWIGIAAVIAVAILAMR